ncbi:tetratricopeptide repeat protein [Fodinicola acaciae]|uniref:tetratricopeptide repeat protein n=1 Tax=Fodinicola acaciae TaxID=2681555 RepID=UPI0013D76D16|nr:tetratricopeptide repeat protein [Fodinicola acaciae]
MSDPQNGLVEQATALLELGRPDQADAVIGRILAADPTDRDGLALLIQRHSGDADRVEYAARRLLSAYPQDIYGLTMLAAAWHDQGRDDEAEPLLRHAITLDPDEPATLIMLGLVLAESPDGLAEALDLADRVVRIAPGSISGFRARAQFLARQERWPEAQVAALDALRLDPTDPELLLLLGLVRAMLGDLAQSAADVRTALSLDPRESQLRVVLEVVAAIGVPDPLFELYLTLLSALGADRDDYRTLYGRELQALGDFMQVDGDADGIVSRATRALDLAERLDEPHNVRPLAEALQDIIDGVPPGHPLALVTERAWKLSAL